MNLSKFGVIIIILLTALVYCQSFFSPFFQDDKILLELSRNGKIFEPIANFPYRPISQQLFFFLAQKTFGYQVIFYHLVLFVLFGATLFVINSLGKTILKNKKRALLATFFYALNVSLFANFYWVATSYFSIGAFFFFLTIWLYIKKSSWTILIFILALTSNEIAFVLPILLALISWYKHSWHKLILWVIGISVIFLLFRIFIVGFPKADAYTMQFNFQALSTLRWYLLRALNLPEGVRGESAKLIYGLFAIFISCLVWSIYRNPRIKIIIFGSIFFIVSLLPFLFLPSHMSSYYLTMSLFGPSLIFARVLTKNLILPTIIIYLLLTIFGLWFLSDSHWIILKNTGPIGQFTSL